MDFPTFLKGATDLNTTNNSSTNANDTQKQQSQWQPWDAGGEDDSWEDVTEVAPTPTTHSTINSTGIPQSTSFTNDLNPNHDLPTTTPSTFTLPSDPVNPFHLSQSTAASTTNITTNAKPTHESSPSSAVTTSSTTTTTTAETVTSNFDEQQIVQLQSQLKTALDRASAAERKCIALSRTRTNNTSSSSDIENKLQAALKEGDKLSVRIAEKEQSVRTLKNTLRQRDVDLEDSLATTSALSAKLEASVSKLKQLETNERAAIDARDAAERRMREVEADARGNKSSSVALDTLRLQLENLRKNQQTALETQSMRMTAEKDTALQEKDAKYQQREEQVEKSMNEMRQHLSQVVSHGQWKEDQSRRDNDDLRQRCQQLEARNEELAEALSGATKPLIRQVEALQAAATERENAKEISERAGVKRIRIAERTAAEARQREQAAEEKLSEVLAKVAGLEERIRISQKEIRHGLEEIDRVRRECIEREERAAEKVKDAEERVKRAERMSEEGREEAREARKMMVEGMEGGEERERELRGMVAEAEAKAAMLMERERDLRKKMTSRSANSADADEKNSSLNKLRRQIQNAEEDQGDEGGVYDQERLSTSLKLRRGEVEKLHSQLESKEKATRALAEEVVSLTSKLESAEKSQDEQQREMEAKKLEALTKRHETLLELLGEREERIGELEADLGDVKTMYKEQVTELLLRIERLNA